MSHRVCVIFEKPSDAIRATQTLLGDERLPAPLHESLLCSPVDRARGDWLDLRGLVGASCIGAAAGLVIALGVAAIGVAMDLTPALGIVALTGIVTGAVCGLVLGLLAAFGGPVPPMRRLRRVLSPGQAALAVVFMDAAATREARSVLLRCPGARTALSG